MNTITKPITLDANPALVHEYVKVWDELIALAATPGGQDTDRYQELRQRRAELSMLLRRETDAPKM